MRMKLFLVLMLIPVSIFMNASVKPVTGTWINLAYQDVRNKYTNPRHFDNTDPLLWEQKIRELADVGIEYLVFMAVANEGEAYYPSKFMPAVYPSGRKSPVDAIMDTAGKLGMKVFLSTGWAKDQDDNLRDPAIKRLQLQIMDELTALYRNHPAFYGWYLPVEDCLCPILEQHAVESVNALCERAHQLTPGKKTLISPYGIADSNFEDPAYEKQLAKLKVDIIAYQDEIGCKREAFPIPRLKKNWERLRAIHDKLNIAFWANCELFTWEKGTNDRESALIPAAFPRVLSQLTAASQAGAEKIISFMVCGIWEEKNSPYQLGQPVWSAKTLRDYRNWLNKQDRWSMLESSFKNELTTDGHPDMSAEKSLRPLFDGKLAEADQNDVNWVRFEPGYQEIVADLGKQTTLNNILFRMLHFAPANLLFPDKIYLFVSPDNINYRLLSIKEPAQFPNNRHDAWIDGVLFENIEADARFVKIGFDANSPVYTDELFIQANEL